MKVWTRKPCGEGSWGSPYTFTSTFDDPKSDFTSCYNVLGYKFEAKVHYSLKRKVWDSKDSWEWDYKVTWTGPKYAITGYKVKWTTKKLESYDVMRKKWTRPVYKRYRRWWTWKDWTTKKTVKVVPKNNFENEVALEAGNQSGIEVGLSSSGVTFRSPGEVALSMTPKPPFAGSTHDINVSGRASHLNDEEVETKNYSLNLNASKPGAYTFRRRAGTQTRYAAEPRPEPTAQLTVRALDHDTGNVVQARIEVSGPEDYVVYGEDTRNVEPGSYDIDFGSADGYEKYVPPREPGEYVSYRIRLPTVLSEGDSKTVTERYERIEPKQPAQKVTVRIKAVQFLIGDDRSGSVPYCVYKSYYMGEVSGRVKKGKTPATVELEGGTYYLAVPDSLLYDSLFEPKARIFQVHTSDSPWVAGYGPRRFKD